MENTTINNNTQIQSKYDLQPLVEYFNKDAEPDWITEKLKTSYEMLVSYMLYDEKFVGNYEDGFLMGAFKGFLEVLEKVKEAKPIVNS